MKNYFKDEDIAFITVGEGVKRKIKAHHSNIMCVEVHFETNSIAPVHTHEHEQVTYVISGQFEFEIEGKKTLIGAGDSIYLQANIPHGVVCKSGGVVLDHFTPMREDFL